MNFGAVIVGGAGGSVTISPKGERRTAGSAFDCYETANVEYTPAIIAIETDVFQKATQSSIPQQQQLAPRILLPPSFVLHGPNNAAITVDNLTQSGLPQLGNAYQYAIGGTIHLSPQHSSGGYQGTLHVYVNFE